MRLANDRQYVLALQSTGIKSVPSLLLLLQFGIAFHAYGDAIDGLHKSGFCISIVLFLISSF